MKKIILHICCLFGTLVASESKTVLKEVYVGKYVGALSEKEWTDRGCTGQIVTTYNDGVTISVSYSEGILNGGTTRTFPHSSVIARSDVFDKGQLISTMTHYPSGQPEQERSVLSSGQVAVTRWYADGQIASKEEFNNNSLLKGEYFSHNSAQESSVIDGQGQRIVRDAYYNLICKEGVAGGEVVLRSTFFPNGEPKDCTPFLHGQVHGVVKTYLMGGQPHSQEAFVAGQRQGPAIYFSNGQKIAEVTFVAGKKNGIEHHYNDRGDIVEEISWSKDRRHGLSYTIVDGAMHEQWFHQGKKVTQFAFEFFNLNP